MLNLEAAQALLSRLPIRDWPSGQLCDFRFRYNQTIALDRLKTQAAAGKPVRAIFDKARRVGVSSMIDGLGVIHCISQPNARAKIAAQLDETAKGLFDVPLTLVKGLDHTGYRIPDPTQMKITFPHPDGDSDMTISTAKNLMGGRGLSFSFLHLSEAAYYQGKAPFTSMLPAVADHPDTIIAVESTANTKVGIGQAFYDFWCDAVYGRNEYLAIFLGWIDDALCRRPAEEAVKDCPANDDEKDIIQLTACPDFCGRCEKCHKALECVAWRRWALVNILQGDVDKFHQEYPINWEESFITTQNQAFTRDELRHARQMIKDPIAVGRLETDVSPARDPLKPVVFLPDSRSPLHIWQHPVRGHHYYVGSDAARGMDNKDYASAYVWCGETGEGVAQYSSRINPESLAELLNYLGLYYNKAMLAVELTGNLGLWAQKVLRDTYRYPNLYRWKGRDDRQPEGYVRRQSIGWETTARTRPMMFDAFRIAIRFGRAKMYDQALLSQMESAEMIEGRWTVRTGHDDILMGALIGWIVGEQWHSGGLGTRAKLLDLEGGQSRPDSVESERDMQAIAKADNDVQGQVRAHFNRIMGHIKRGGPAKDRLEGI